MGNRQGSGFLGSPDIQTSVANQEIVPNPPVGWTTGYSLYKLNFYNMDNCHVKINGGDPIYLGAYQGFSSNEIDLVINSFIVVEENINFTFVAYY